MVTSVSLARDEAENLRSDSWESPRRDSWGGCQTFTNGKFEDVTRSYTQHLKSHAWEMYQAFLQSKKEQYEVNGILAGYVAQKILLGEYEQGWKFMLANYDRTSDWGLTIYQEDREIGKYLDFPTALKAFLIQQGYLDKNG